MNAMKRHSLFGRSQRFKVEMPSTVLAAIRSGTIEANYQFVGLPRRRAKADCLACTYIRIIGFRSVLVHEYLEISLDIVYGVMQANLKDLEKILKEMMKVLKE